MIKYNKPAKNNNVRQRGVINIPNTDVDHNHSGNNRIVAINEFPPRPVLGRTGRAIIYYYTCCVIVVLYYIRQYYRAWCANEIKRYTDILRFPAIHWRNFT